MDYRFPKQYKMTLQADIDAIMSDSERVFGKNLVFRYRITDKLDAELKVLVIAPKRRYKKAVTRNRIKRQLREMIRSVKPAIIEVLPPEKALHLAVIYTGPPKMEFTDQQKAFLNNLRKIPLLNLNNN